MKTPTIALALVSVVMTSGAFIELSAQRDGGPPVTPAGNAIEVLNRRVRDGDARLEFEERSGYLRSVLDALAVPVESQMLVFSKSSLQARAIGPTNPRAILFNRSVYVGFVRGGELLEVAVDDPRGMLFYTLDQRPANLPQFRETTICLSCHRTKETLGIPGLLVLNTGPVDPAAMFVTGSVPDHRTPFSERWGGWYVTGPSGGARHNGNRTAGMVPVHERQLASVHELFDTGGYPSTESDIAVTCRLSSDQSFLENSALGARS